MENHENNQKRPNKGGNHNNKNHYNRHRNGKHHGKPKNKPMGEQIGETDEIENLTAEKARAQQAAEFLSSGFSPEPEEERKYSFDYEPEQTIV